MTSPERYLQNNTMAYLDPAYTLTPDQAKESTNLNPGRS